jgi:predicted O-linked N-acetylglucosamine transferase (SPINDLY family)
MKRALQLAQILEHGMTAHRQGRLADAERSYQAVLNVKRDDFDSLHLLGVVRWQQRRHDEASLLIKQALRVRPDSAEACANLGIVLLSLDRPAEAMTAYDRALAINPRYAKALCHRGDALRALGRNAEALASYDKALAAAADYAEAHVNRGVVLRELGRHAEALASFERALALQPANPEILYNRGNSLQSLGRFEEALRDYDAVLAGNPRAAEAHNNRGCVLEKLGRFDEALASFDAALALRSDNPEALHNRGNALLALSRHDEALASYERALALAPHRLDTLHNRAQTLVLLRRYEEAIAAFEAVLTIEPASPSASAGLANCRLLTCDWHGVAQVAERARTAAQSGDWSGLDPFTALCIFDEPADHLEYARAYVRRSAPPAAQMTRVQTAREADRLRIAYLSSDFRNHPVVHLTAELYERHDRCRFEVIGISFGPDDKSEARARVVKAFDSFHDVRSMSDADAAALVRSLDIDIAVDLNGHTEGARLGILARRPAPIAVQYLGYLGTMGADFIDYVIADAIVLPHDQQAFYTERIVHLPECFQICDTVRPAPSQVPSRSELGLPEDGFVFCCFNNAYKITPAVSERWMRLLKSVSGSVFWLYGANAAAMTNLRSEAQSRGVDPARLVFAPALPLAEYRARLCRADLFLDTLPYNAGATANDALAAGLPIVTCAGRAFAGRMGASLLNAVGLPELITPDLDAYEALALKLAVDRRLLESMRNKLLKNRETSPLFDVERTCRHIEVAYETMWDIHRRGDSPRSFPLERN